MSRGGYRGGQSHGGYGGRRGRGGGGGHHRGGGGGYGGGESSSHAPNGPSTADELRRLLVGLEGAQYGAYKSQLQGRTFGDANDPRGALHFGWVQTDPFARPSSLAVRLSSQAAAFPDSLVRNRIRRTALADFLSRGFHAAVLGLDGDSAAAAPRHGHGSGYHSTPLGGKVLFNGPGQHVLERTSVIAAEDGSIECRFSLGLPGRGRTIMGRRAAEILCDQVPMVVARTLLYARLDAENVAYHVKSVEDQEEVRGSLAAHGLTAFVRDGAILPRFSGVSDLPMSPRSAVPFESPSSLRVTLPLVNGGTVTGMGVRTGVTLIAGGGFHGKSTLLSALKVGMYNHVPGDGREFVTTDSACVSVRAEDGRCVNGLDLSQFISDLPQGRPTNAFCTDDASGSTSQAANTLEAIEMHVRLLLIDEDTCATNFMVRDEQMAQLVACEPITPFQSKMRSLARDHDISTVLVVGSSGSFFHVADTVLQMLDYRCLDVTARAREIAQAQSTAPPNTPFERTPTARTLQADVCARVLSLGDAHRLRTTPDHTFPLGPDASVSLTHVEQLVECGQTRSIALALFSLPHHLQQQQSCESLPSLIARLSRQLDQSLDAHTSRTADGDLVRPRPFELAAALSRVRGVSFVPL